MPQNKNRSERFGTDMYLNENDFSRKDEQDDGIFYAKERPGPHLDSTALDTVERIMGKLDLHSCAELVKFAIRTGLIDLN